MARVACSGENAIGVMANNSFCTGKRTFSVDAPAASQPATLRWPATVGATRAMKGEAFPDLHA